MSFSIGIIGLPNVGKSTLFNALTRSKQAAAENYPFCTIDPNVGVVEVPDERLGQLSQVSKSRKTIPTVVEFVDIAGLVKGASEGEGLGNKFLSHVREVDAIVQVVRAFSDDNVTHVNNKIDPRDDAEVVNVELALADMQTIGKRLAGVKKSLKSGVAKEAAEQIELLEKVKTELGQSRPVRFLDYSEKDREILDELQLLTMKPMLYVVNSDEGVDGWVDFGGQNQAEQIVISAKLEAELAALSETEAREYLRQLNISETGLDKLIRAGYKLLNLITFFTSGEPETRAWTVSNGVKAPEAAGVIHTDFSRGFIKADVCAWQDLVANGGWPGVKASGKLRLEGKDYTMRDGDVVYFHVNV